MVDKNLFLHDLAIVATIKNEGHYLKEWLDYHLMAGVDHFYLYDHESDDNYNEIVKPYVDAGLVTSTSYPNKQNMFYAYNDALKRFKYQCRYMSFIDGDEFIYPKVDRGGACNVVEVVDELLADIPDAGELSISWQIFGSNGHETADYSKGVLERFTRRAVNSTNPITFCKFVANPRTINFLDSPHAAVRFEGIFAINEQKKIKPHPPWNNIPPLTEKIVVNHYHCKSWEEYQQKSVRGYAANLSVTAYTREQFDGHDLNEEFDDGILHYRDERAKIYQPPDKSHADERLLNALIKNLSLTLLPTTPPDFYARKMETFLTCRAVAAYLQTKLTDDTAAKFFEEASLKAILKSFGGMSLPDARMFIRELPELLRLPYPAVQNLRNAALDIIPQLIDIFRAGNAWQVCTELNCINELLKE